MDRPRIEPYKDFAPRIDPTAFVHPSAVIIGDVVLGPRVSVWPTAVLRGDQGAVRIGEATNIQDAVVAHATRGLSTVRIGRRVTVGHRALLHGCEVQDDVLVGMGAILLDNCVIESGCIIGAGALVPVGRRIPARSVVMGVPARVVGTVTDEELETVIAHGCQEYLRLAADYRGRHG